MTYDVWRILCFVGAHVLKSMSLFDLVRAFIRGLMTSYERWANDFPNQFQISITSADHKLLVDNLTFQK